MMTRQKITVEKGLMYFKIRVFYLPPILYKYKQKNTLTSILNVSNFSKKYIVQ